MRGMRMERVVSHLLLNDIGSAIVLLLLLLLAVIPIIIDGLLT